MQEAVIQEFNGKVALVTGAGSGIGLASACLLAAHGANVGIGDIDPQRTREAVAAIQAEGGEAFPVQMDISSEREICEAIEGIARTYGRLDILHNNAAFTTSEVLDNDVDILTISTENWDAVMRGTLRGTMLCCRYGILEMLKHGSGSIINTSSMYGVTAFNRMPAYCVSKAGINMLTEHIASVYGRNGIRCNAVAPSMITTPLLESTIPQEFISINADSTSVGYLGTPEDVAQAVAWLASDRARYITGQIIRVDGGTTCHLPTYADARRFFG